MLCHDDEVSPIGVVAESSRDHTPVRGAQARERLVEEEYLRLEGNEGREENELLLAA